MQPQARLALPERGHGRLQGNEARLPALVGSAEGVSPV